MGIIKARNITSYYVTDTYDLQAYTIHQVHTFKPITWTWHFALEYREGMRSEWDQSSRIHFCIRGVVKEKSQYHGLNMPRSGIFRNSGFNRIKLSKSMMLRVHAASWDLVSDCRSANTLF